MAIIFNGTTQYLVTAANSTLFATITSAVTVMCWVYYTSVSGTQSAIAKFDTGANYSFALGNFDGTVTSQFTTNSTNTNNISATALVAGVWTHIAATWDSVSAKQVLYVNGALSSSATTAGTSIALANSEMCIGAALQTIANGSPTFFMNGRIEDVRIYNRLLSAGEILTIANCSGRDNIVANLMLHYPLDEGSLTTVATTSTIIDHSVNKLAIATVVASPTYVAGATSLVRQPITVT